MNLVRVKSLSSRGFVKYIIAEIVDRWPGKQALGKGRERVADNLDGYKEFIEAFIQRWSELQSLDD